MRNRDVSLNNANVSVSNRDVSLNNANVSEKDRDVSEKDRDVSEKDRDVSEKDRDAPKIPGNPLDWHGIIVRNRPAIAVGVLNCVTSLNKKNQNSLKGVFHPLQLPKNGKGV